MVTARPNHTPSELAEAAAKAVVTAQNLEYTGGAYLDDFGWALGGVLTYERGLALFATAALDVAAAAADSPGESDVDMPWAWEDFAMDDSSDRIEGKYILTITCEGEERAVIVHRVQAGRRYELDGVLMQAKRSWAQHIVDALNAQAVSL